MDKGAGIMTATGRSQTDTVSYAIGVLLRSFEFQLQVFGLCEGDLRCTLLHENWPSP